MATDESKPTVPPASVPLHRLVLIVASPSVFLTICTWNMAAGMTLSFGAAGTFLVVSVFRKRLRGAAILSVGWAMAFGFLLLVYSRGEGVTPLMLAARSGNTFELKRIVSRGTELDEQSRYGWTALMFAAWKGHTESVRILLNAGADPNVFSDSVPSQFETVTGHPPSSALQEAIRNGHLSIAAILIEGGATIDPGSVALAGRTGDVEFLSHLVQEGADINTSSRNAFYATPLCTAAASGKLEMVEWLIENGADPNQIAASQTALKEAVNNDEPNIVRYLLENGANPNVVYGTTEQTALFTAVTKHTAARNYAGNLSIIKMLLTYGADTRHKAFGGRHTALEFIENHRANNLKYLDEATTEEVKARYQASLSHKDAVIALLKNQ